MFKDILRKNPPSRSKYNYKFEIIIFNTYKNFIWSIKYFKKFIKEKYLKRICIFIFKPLIFKKIHHDTPILMF